MIHSVTSQRLQNERVLIMAEGGPVVRRLSSYYHPKQDVLNSPSDSELVKRYRLNREGIVSVPDRASNELTSRDRHQGTRPSLLP